ncbi:hypothetical protein HHI36_003322 [Cryptolaemus montrouzieri]|uniref:RecF/RecN/SMC N-terminal domain-containing protein n=1 Tax=Cryptolaemus montrouzieri TaxID=559131 RepID=A0ABD2PE18_9CUCU
MESSSSGIKRPKLKQTALQTSKRQKTEETQDNDQEKRAGVITRILLKNFMCHSMLEVNFINNTSVVTGQNGSGKSAILTALVVGLGGKASLTNRGTSIKGFVKAGRNSATVEITMYNGGPMAYRPNIYGDSITVSRHFTASGSSSYKIRDHTGKMISNQAREVQNIVNSLNIQVDNPICVLNQDTSRNFLSSNDPKHKFTLFVKATKLETLAIEYSRIMTNMRDSIRLLEDKTRNFGKMKDDIKKLKHRINQHKSMKNLKDERASLHAELLWAKVRDMELEIQSQMDTIDGLSKKYDNFKQNTAKRSEEVERLRNSIREVEQQICELKNTIEVQSRPYSDAKKTLEKLMMLYQEKDREKRSLQNTIKSKKQDIQVLEQDITNSNENMKKVEQEKVERLRRIEEMEQKIKANEDILQTARNEVFQLKSDVARKEQDDSNFKQEIREIEQRISQYQERLRSLENEDGNSLLLYGRHIPQVRQLIEQNKNKFQQIPRGPLGSYIKLKDKKWAVAAEGYIGKGLLNSFLVDNKTDNQLLVQLFNKVAPDRIPTIITSKFYHEVHNVSKNLVQAPSDCVGLFDMLEIEDPVVANCIIDESNVEGILLIPSDDRAMKLLSNIENVPRNCTQGVTIKGDRYFPDPNYKTYCSDYHQAQYLQVDAGDYLKQLNDRIEASKQQKQAVLNQYKQIKNEMNIQRSKQNELETKIKRLITNRSDIRRQLDELKATAEPEATSIEVLETELLEVKNVLNEKTANLERLDEELKELGTPMKETEVRLKHLKSAIKNLEERVPTLQDQIREKKIRIREISTNTEFDDRKIAECEARLQEHRARLVTKQSNKEHHLNEATKLGLRPDGIRGVAEVMDKLSSIETAIRQIQTSSENIDDILEQYKNLTEKSDRANEILNKLGDNVNELKVAARMRKKHYQNTETYFISYIKHSFQKILEFRQFKGSLEIDVEAKKLELIVIPQQGTQGLTTTSNLSGGERSFSTVAFLYSLWQCMEFPFYFLDEFDVYMDKLNRSKVFDILLHHASTKPQLQFVFLTPQDVSFLSRNVTILRLEDPKRFNS